MEEKSACDRCGRQLPARRLKEIVYEEGRKRLRLMVCPGCLDKIMNTSERVRGVVGTAKRAAAHVDSGSGPAERQSFGERN